MSRFKWPALAVTIVAAAVAASPARAEKLYCSGFAANIVAMERSVPRSLSRELSKYLRILYADQCVLNPTRTRAAEYWYSADGTPLGIAATYTPPGWDPARPYRPEEGAYTTTPQIAADCRRIVSMTPSMCAMVKGIEAACLKPIDSQERTQCAAILEGRIPDLPPAADELPPLRDVLRSAPSAAPLDNAAYAADPGFQRMCGEARNNFNQCTVRRQNMSSIGGTGDGGTGQAGAFYECQQLYSGVLSMCASTGTIKAVRQAIAAPPVREAAQKPGNASGQSAPPPGAAKPTIGGGPGWVADPKTGCHARAEGAPPQVSMSWTGPCVNGRAQGTGKLSWFLGGQLRDTYEGEYQNGMMNGRGTLTSVDGGRYEGQFRNDKPEGRGVRSWPDGTKYDGEFKAGEPDGMGTYWGPVEGGPKAGEWHAYKGQWRQGCFASPPYFAAIGSAIPEECEVLMGTR